MPVAVCGGRLHMPPAVGVTIWEEDHADNVPGCLDLFLDREAPGRMLPSPLRPPGT